MMPNESQIPSDPANRSATDCSSCREQFEQFISDEPFAKSIERIPDDPEKFAFPGVYRDINTDLAWQAWKEAWELGDKCRDGCKIKRWVKEAQDSLTVEY